MFELRLLDRDHNTTSNSQLIDYLGANLAPGCREGHLNQTGCVHREWIGVGTTIYSISRSFLCERGRSPNRVVPRGGYFVINEPFFFIAPPTGPRRREPRPYRRRATSAYGRASPSVAAHFDESGSWSKAGGGEALSALHAAARSLRKSRDCRRQLRLEASC
jgi:hypothetical protein